MMPLSFVVVCEAHADFEMAATLVDRTLCEYVDLMEPQVIDSYRQYKGIRPESPFLTWGESSEVAKKLGRRAHGHFQGKPGDLDAIAGRKAILVVLDQFPDVKSIFLIRDSDGLTARKAGLNQARAEVKATNFVVVIGVAHCKREAWVLAGFDPRDEEEHRLIDELRQELGFHPCEQNHQLHATHDGDKRSAKRVLAILVRGDRDREAACWRETPLHSLHQRGTENDLVHFLNEVKDRVVPLFSGPRSVA